MLAGVEDAGDPVGLREQCRVHHREAEARAEPADTFADDDPTSDDIARSSRELQKLDQFKALYESRAMILTVALKLVRDIISTQIFFLNFT